MGTREHMLQLQAAAIEKDRESDRLERQGKRGEAKLAEMRANAYRRAYAKLRNELRSDR